MCYDGFDLSAYNSLQNLHTTRALATSCQRSQTGSPPTKMFPSWGPDPPTSFTSDDVILLGKTINDHKHNTWKAIISRCMSITKGEVVVSTKIVLRAMSIIVTADKI